MSDKAVYRTAPATRGLLNRRDAQNKKKKLEVDGTIQLNQ